MAIITDTQELKNLREAGRRLAAVLDACIALAQPGVAAREIDALGERLIREGGDDPAFLDYHPEFADRPFPATVCISVNDEVVHGIPTEGEYAFKEGDIVGLDIGLVHKGMVVDMAKTIPIGNVDDDATQLLAVTQTALKRGIEAALVGGRVGDIGFAIETYVAEYGYGIVRTLGGHGVGRSVHEDPHIPHFGKKGTGEMLTEGLVIAIEPMINEGGHAVDLLDDGYTFVTRDGSRSAHFEHTIRLTKNGPEIITTQ